MASLQIRRARLDRPIMINTRFEMFNGFIRASNHGIFTVMLVVVDGLAIDLFASRGMDEAGLTFMEEVNNCVSHVGGRPKFKLPSHL